MELRHAWTVMSIRLPTPSFCSCLLGSCRLVQVRMSWDLRKSSGLRVLLYVIMLYDTPQFNHLAHFRDHASILFPEERSWPSVSPPKPIAVPTSSGRMTRVPLSAEMMRNEKCYEYPPSAVC